MTRRRISREEYLDRSLSRQQPWVAENISRRTWERRRLRDRDASPQADSPEQGVVASQADDERLAAARANVEAIYAEMAEERERRARWWAQMLDDPPDCITSRNIVRDEVITIHLDGDPARKKRKPHESVAPRMWWDDSPS